MTSHPTILAIETSCDETALALLRQSQQGNEVIAQALASQADLHKVTGGVVPENAARQHALTLPPLLQQLSEQGTLDLQHPAIDAIAVTVGPGLIPALSVGVTAARSLAFAWNKPIIPIHHLEGHIYSALLQTHDSKTYTLPENSFPSLALLVSGGHTLLVEVTNHLQYTIIGTTIDDAAGEAFDKVARLLGLPYPGGPALSSLAQAGDPAAYDFPRPLKNSSDLNFSFSGLKTAVLYQIRDIDSDQLDQQKPHLAASFEQAVVDSLLNKTKKALQQKSYNRLLLAGGVAANQRLRATLGALAQTQNIPLSIAPLELCGDNAVMIGLAGLYAYQQNRRQTWQQTDATARINLETMNQS